MAIIAAKFVKDSTTVNFYDDEAVSIRREYKRGYDLYQVENQRFGLYYTDLGYNIITVNFQIKYGPFETNTSSTLYKLDTIYDWIDSEGQPEKVKCYYKMKWDTSAWYWVQMFREGMSWDYSVGRETADHYLPITFVQTL